MLFSSLFMTGIIWFVQIIHYPLYKKIDRQSFLAYEQLHTRLAFYLIGPMMLAELVSTLIVAWLFTHTLTILLLIMVVVMWLSTFMVQARIHRQLTKAYDETKLNRLIRTNWFRTIVWTVKGIGAVVWCLEMSFSIH